jgi:exportin-1
MTPRVATIFEATFQPTLNMITKDFAEYPEHRTGFYSMLKSINKHCFPALLELAPGQFKLFIDSIVWGFKHTMRDIADIGLEICGELIDNISRTDAAIAGAFYQSYYLSLLQDIFFVLTDSDHKSGNMIKRLLCVNRWEITILIIGFKGQTEVLARLFELVSSNKITAPLFDPSQVTNPNMTNADFLQEHVSTLLQNAFPHLQR